MLVAQSCPTVCYPMDCSQPASPVHGILQARILEWVAIPFSRGSFWLRDQTRVSCIAGRFFKTDKYPKEQISKTTWLFISSICFNYFYIIIQLYHLSLVTESNLSQSNFLYLNVFKIPLVNKFWLKKNLVR